MPNYIEQMRQGQVGPWPTLPIEDIMGGYEQQAMGGFQQWLPESRDYWSNKGLLRSGMARGAELERMQDIQMGLGTLRSGLMQTGWQAEQQRWLTQFQSAVQYELKRMGLSAQATQSLWGTIGNLLGKYLFPLS